MSNVVDLPTKYKDRRGQHQALRMLVDQRARELAALYQERLFLAMLFEIHSGKLDADLLPYWQPIKGEIVAPPPGKA